MLGRRSLTPMTLGHHHITRQPRKKKRPDTGPRKRDADSQPLCPRRFLQILDFIEESLSGQPA